MFRMLTSKSRLAIQAAQIIGNLSISFVCLSRGPSLIVMLTISSNFGPALSAESGHTMSAAKITTTY